MAGEYKIVLNGFGLENSRPKEFSQGSLKELSTGGGALYSKQNAEPDSNFGIASAQEVSLLGTPVFNKLIILPGVYLVRKFGAESIPVPYAGITLDTALMTVSMSKQIISTQVQGRRGTIKEYISNGDFTVNIKGSIVDSSASRYPLERVLLLRSICEAPVSILVASDYLALFSITHLVIQSYSFPQMEGYRNVQMFELNCISDAPIDFNIKDLI
jgi:hypothetical protein